MIDLLATQVADLREERKILMDRLATLGLGGPLFRKEVAEEQEKEPEQEELIDPFQEERDLRARYRHRPSRLIEELERLQRRRARTGGKPPWTPSKIASVLDATENELKEQAS
jgi:hypothetical protein